MEIVDGLGAISMSAINVKMWLIRMYYNDLAEYFAGDDGRFTRMVVDGGEQFDTASPAGWAKHIANCTTAETLVYCRAELDQIYAQLGAWGLPAEMPPPQP